MLNYINKNFDLFFNIVKVLVVTLIFSLILIYQVYLSKNHAYDYLVTTSDGKVYHARNVNKSNNFVKFTCSNNEYVEVSKYAIKEIKYVGRKYDKELN